MREELTFGNVAGNLVQTVTGRDSFLGEDRLQGHGFFASTTRLDPGPVGTSYSPCIRLQNSFQVSVELEFASAGGKAYHFAE